MLQTVFMRTIDQDHSGDISWILGLIKANHHPTQRMSDQHIRTRNIRSHQQKMEIVHSLIERIEFRACIAPSISRAIIGADSREPG